MALDMAKLSTPVTGYHGANQFSNTQEAAEQRKRVMNHRAGRRRGRGREKGRERRESNHMLAHHHLSWSRKCYGRAVEQGRTDGRGSTL